MQHILLILFLMTEVFAVVDIATKDFQEDDEGFSGSLYGSFEKKRGSSDKDDSEFGGLIQYDTKHTVTWIQGEIENDKSNDVKTEDNYFIHLRHIHQLYSRDWATEYFAQEKRDRFKNLDSRFIYGAGVRYRFFNTPPYGKAFLGMALFDEYIDYSDQTFDSNEHNYRANSYLSYNLNFSNNLEFSSIVHYQPKINNGSDFMISSLSEMTIHLTKVIDLSYTLEFTHDSEPAFEVPESDTRQKLSFVYRFGKDDPFSNYAHNFLKSLDQLEEVNASSVVAVEVQTDIEDIEDSSDTLVGVWTRKEETFTLALDGTGSYLYDNGLYNQKLEWKLISTETQEGEKGAREQGTKIVVIRYVDEEGRIGRIENYLWSKDRLVGLYDQQVKIFRR